MATLSLQPHYSTLRFRIFHLSSFNLKAVPRFSRQIYGKRVRVSTSISRGNAKIRGRFGGLSVSCFSKMDAEIEKVSSEEQEEEEEERPPFDINLAVILAGFAFEAYTTPPENIGRREIDAADCKTVYLSGSFVREIYDGQLFIKLKKGFDFPAMDPWGTSDPYVVMQLDGQVVKSKTKWGTKEPTWNEDLTFNIKLPPSKYIQETCMKCWWSWKEWEVEAGCSLRYTSLALLLQCIYVYIGEYFPVSKRMVQCPFELGSYHARITYIEVLKNVRLCIYWRIFPFL
ncbi:hypothetical protein V6Z11_D02G040100 [Gossypium hirsutum]